MNNKDRKIIIFNPNNKKEALKINLTKTSYWKNISEIIENKGCTNEEYNYISCYLVKRSGRTPFRQKIINTGQEMRHSLLDSFIQNILSGDVKLPYNILKACIAIYLYKEYSVLFFNSKQECYPFFKYE